MTQTVFLPALLLSMTALVAGCGGDDDGDGADEPAAVSKTDFVTQANKICAEGNEVISSAATEIAGEPTDEQITEFADEVLVPNIQGQHDDIEALGAPEGDEDEVQAILDALQEGIDTVEADPSTITSSDPFGDASQLAGDYGLEECAA